MLDSILNSYLTEPGEFPSIIEFAEARWGLGQTLLPTQKFVFKLIYGLPLDKSERTIRITDKFNEHCYDLLSEYEYFRFLQSEERINLHEPPESPMHEIVEVIGRRGSKSFMASCLGSYEIYRMLYEIKDPHGYFGISKTDPIRVLLVSNAKSQAEIIFNQIKEASSNCDRMSKYISNNTKEELIFFTPAQVERYGGKLDSLKDRRGLLSAFVGTSNSRNIRGVGCIVVVMDEFAHFVTNSGVKSDSATYEAIAPAVSAFGTQAKKVLISSPWSKVGKFYELYKLGMDKPELQDTMLVLRIPTWGMNPTIPSDYLKHQFTIFGKTAYDCEFGAVFSDSKNSWIEDEAIVSDSILSTRAPHVGKRYVKYFWAIDQAQKSDAFAIAVGHREKDLVIVDYKKDYYGSEEARELVRNRGFDTADQYEFTKKRIQYPQDYQDLVNELKSLNKKFPVTEGIMDQWSGVLLQQIFEKQGLKNFQVVSFTDKLNSDIYDLLRLLMTLGQFKMYDDPYFVNQLLTLEEEKRSKGITSVQAPDRPGYNDDLSDAVARLVWLMIQGPKGSSANKRHAPITSGAHIGVSSVSSVAREQQKKIAHRSDYRLF